MDIGIFSQDTCSPDSANSLKFSIFLDSTRTVSAESTTNSVKTTLKSSVTVSGWTSLIFISDGSSLNVIGNLKTSSILTLPSMFSPKCDVSIGRPKVITNEKAFMLRELKIGFYPLSTNYIYHLANSAMFYLDLNLSYYFKLNVLDASQNFYDEVSQTYISLTTSTSDISQDYIYNFLDSPSLFNGYCPNTELLYPKNGYLFCSSKLLY
jgi:hypothetical protein